MFRYGLLLVLVLGASAPLGAQTPTGTIAGAVTNQTGALLSKALVTITNRDTGATRVVETRDDGSFSVPSLLAGRYDVLVAAIGFQPVTTPVTVTTGPQRPSSCRSS
jgi:hypothetical protein